jgi:hypothetical protein
VSRAAVDFNRSSVTPIPIAAVTAIQPGVGSAWAFWGPPTAPTPLLAVSTPIAISWRFRYRGLLISKPNLALRYHPIEAINAAADSVLGVAPGHWQQPHDQMLTPRYHRTEATSNRGHHGLPHLEAVVRHGRHMVSFGPRAIDGLPND